MDAEKPKRPWWRLKRWRFALAAWLLLPLTYPLSYVAIMYADGRGWVSTDHYSLLASVYRPLFRIRGMWEVLTPLGDLARDLAERHRDVASD